MSESYTTPMAATFEFQRRTIEQSHRFAERMLDAQATAMDAAMASMTAGRNASESTTAMFRSAMHAALDAAETSMPADDLEALRTFVDEQFDAADRTGDDAWTVIEETVEEFEAATEELTAAQRDMLADAVESTLDAHAAVEREATGVVRSTVEGEE
jgi:hypothetical protein